MPFAGYENFAACVSDQKTQGHSANDSRAICGALERDSKSYEGKAGSRYDKSSAGKYRQKSAGYYKKAQKGFTAISAAAVVVAKAAIDSSSLSNSVANPEQGVDPNKKTKKKKKTYKIIKELIEKGGPGSGVYTRKKPTKTRFQDELAKKTDAVMKARKKREDAIQRRAKKQAVKEIKEEKKKKEKAEKELEKKKEKAKKEKEALSRMAARSAKSGGGRGGGGKKSGGGKSGGGGGGGKKGGGKKSGGGGGGRAKAEVGGKKGVWGKPKVAGIKKTQKPKTPSEMGDKELAAAYVKSFPKSKGQKIPSRKDMIKRMDRLRGTAPKKSAILSWRPKKISTPRRAIPTRYAAAEKNVMKKLSSIAMAVEKGGVGSGRKKGSKNKKDKQIARMLPWVPPMRKIV